MNKDSTFGQLFKSFQICYVWIEVLSIYENSFTLGSFFYSSSPLVPHRRFIPSYFCFETYLSKQLGFRLTLYVQFQSLSTHNWCVWATLKNLCILLDDEIDNDNVMKLMFKLLFASCTYCVQSYDTYVESIRRLWRMQQATIISYACSNVTPRFLRTQTLLFNICCAI